MQIKVKIKKETEETIELNFPVYYQEGSRFFAMRGPENLISVSLSSIAPSVFISTLIFNSDYQKAAISEKITKEQFYDSLRRTIGQIQSLTLPELQEPELEVEDYEHSFETSLNTER